jgi:hypothetical protein
MATFSAAGQKSSVLLVGLRDTINIVLDDGAGTFSGTIELQGSTNGFATYDVIRSYTGNITDEYQYQESEYLFLRLVCTAYSGDSIDYTFEVDKTVADKLRFHEHYIIDKKGHTSAEFTHAGIDVKGELTVNGAPVPTGNGFLFLDPVGDATTDTFQIQQAMDNLGDEGGTIFLGPGDWYINSTLTKEWTTTWTPLIKFQGYGMYSTRLINQLATDDYIFDFTTSTDYVYGTGLTFHDMSFQGEGYTAANHRGGVLIRGVWHVNFQRCNFSNLSGDAITINNESVASSSAGDRQTSLYVDIANCTFDDIGGWAIDAGASIAAINVKQCYSSRAGGFFRGKPLLASYIENCGIAYCQRNTAIRIDNRGRAAARLMHIRNTGFEGNLMGDIYLSGNLHEVNNVSFVDAKVTGTDDRDESPQGVYGIRFGDDYDASGSDGVLGAVSDKVQTFTAASANFPETVVGQCIYVYEEGDFELSYPIVGWNSATSIDIYAPEGAAHAGPLEWETGFPCAMAKFERANVVIVGMGESATIAAARGSFLPSVTAPDGSNNQYLQPGSLGGRFRSTIVGSDVTILDSATPGNNGTFAITAVEPLFGYGTAGGTISAPVANEQTITITSLSGTIPANCVGKYIHVTDTTNPANTGLFVITTKVSANSVKYLNPAGGAETNASFAAWIGPWVEYNNAAGAADISTDFSWRTEGPGGTRFWKWDTFYIGDYQYNYYNKIGPHYGQLFADGYNDNVKHLRLNTGPLPELDYEFLGRAVTPYNAVYDAGNVATGSYTPDLSLGAHHVVDVTLEGDFTINLPTQTPYTSGPELSFFIRNMVGADTTVNLLWDASYNMPPHIQTNLSNSMGVLARFYWEDSISDWVCTSYTCPQFETHNRKNQYADLSITDDFYHPQWVKGAYHRLDFNTYGEVLIGSSTSFFTYDKPDYHGAQMWMRIACTDSGGGGGRSITPVFYQSGTAASLSANSGAPNFTQTLTAAVGVDFHSFIDGDTILLTGSALGNNGTFDVVSFNPANPNEIVITNPTGVAEGAVLNWFRSTQYDTLSNIIRPIPYGTHAHFLWEWDDAFNKWILKSYQPSQGSAQDFKASESDGTVAAATYTPDYGQGTMFDVTFSSSGTVTVANLDNFDAADNSLNGTEVFFRITASPGAGLTTTIAWDTEFNVGNLKDNTIANGTYRIYRFLFDAGLNRFSLISLYDSTSSKNIYMVRSTNLAFTAATLTPDIATATWYDIDVTSGAAVTIAAPTFVDDISGTELVIRLRNKTGALITFTWNGVYRFAGTGHTTLTALNDYMLAKFYYDSSFNGWFPDGFYKSTGSGTVALTELDTSSLSASQAVFTDGSKALVSNAITGTGNVVMSASPTLTGTASLANLTVSTNTTLSNLTASRAVFTDGSKILTSNAITGTGNVVMSASPTLTGTISAADISASGTITGTTAVSAPAIIRGGFTTMTALAGGGLPTLAANCISTPWTYVGTCATNGDSIRLPTTPTAGDMYFVINGGAKDCAIWPHTGDTIGNLAVNTPMQLHPDCRIGFVAESASQWRFFSTSMRYISLGDLSANHFALGDITADGTYRDLSLTSIIPPSAYGKLIHFKVRLDTASSAECVLRTNGYSNTVNIGGTRSETVNNLDDTFVECDSNGVIEYSVGAAASSFVLTVRGYWVWSM